MLESVKTCSWPRLQPRVLNYRPHLSATYILLLLLSFLFFCFSQSKRSIGHFRVRLSLHFKARLSAKSLLWKPVFIHIEIGTNYRNKSFALRLALKEGLRGTRKWPIESFVSPNSEKKTRHQFFQTDLKNWRFLVWRVCVFNNVVTLGRLHNRELKQERR